jgi:Do/DeqQ family serine protease
LYDNPKKVGSGSGVIVTPDGYIITNNHVIEDHTEIEVILNDNKSYSATLIGTDPATDIAVIKIDAEKSLPFIAFGDSDVAKVGEWVLAVGNPFNLNSTVTAGIISAKSRDLNNYDGKNESFIQTDAAVNMGNSGGALVNTNGELIGINTAISSFTGGFVGYSFAVPSNIARKVFEDIIEFGNVQKGLLGIRGGALDSSVAENYDVLDTEGFYISEVEPDMGADLAGLTKGDIIKKVDDVVIRKFADLSGYLSTKRPNEKVKVTYKRDGETIETFVTLKKINKVSFLGMELQPLNDQQRKNLGLDQNENGVIISKAQNGASYYYGIDEGYAILEINEKKINQLDDVKNISVEDLKSILVVNPDGEKERILFNKYIR